MPVFVLGSCKPTSSLGVLPVPAPTPALRSTLARLKYQPQSPEPAVCPAHPQLEASPPEAMAVWSFSTRGRPLSGPILSPPEVACVQLSSYSCLFLLQPQPVVCAPPEPALAKPHPAMPSTPGLASMAPPMPGLALLALAKSAKAGVAPPATVGLVLPVSPATATPSLALPSPAKPPLPSWEMPVFQACHTWSGTACQAWHAYSSTTGTCHAWSGPAGTCQGSQGFWSLQLPPACQAAGEVPSPPSVLREVPLATWLASRTAPALFAGLTAPSFCFGLCNLKLTLRNCFICS